MKHIFDRLKDKRTPLVERVGLLFHIGQAAVSAWHHFLDQLAAPVRRAPVQTVSMSDGPDAWEVEQRG